MTRWNEEEALALFTPLEWDMLAKLAFDTGSKAEEQAEEALGDDDEMRVDADVAVPLARAALKESALLAAHVEVPRVRQVYEVNFHSG